MNPEGVRFFARDMMKEAPFPEHYEPFEPLIAHPATSEGERDPAARVFKNDLEVFGRPDAIRYAATTYRLTEHFHYWSKHAGSTPSCSQSSSSRSARRSRKKRGSSPASGSRCAATAAGSRRSRW